MDMNPSDSSENSAVVGEPAAAEPTSPYVDAQYEFRAPMFYDFLNPVSDEEDVDRFFDEMNTSITYKDPESPQISSPLYSSPYAPKSIEPRSPMRQLHAASSTIKQLHPNSPKTYSPIPLRDASNRHEGVDNEPETGAVDTTAAVSKPKATTVKVIPSRYMQAYQTQTKPIAKPQPQTKKPSQIATTAATAKRPIVRQPPARPAAAATATRPRPVAAASNTTRTVQRPTTNTSYASVAAAEANKQKRQTTMLPMKKLPPKTPSVAPPRQAAAAPIPRPVPVITKSSNRPTYAQVAATPPPAKNFMRPTAAALAKQQAAIQTREKIIEKHGQAITGDVISKELLASVRRVKSQTQQKRFTPETLRRQREVRAAALTVPITPPFLKRPVRPAREAPLPTEQRQAMEAQQARQKFLEEQRRKREEWQRRRAQLPQPSAARSHHTARPTQPSTATNSRATMNIKVTSQ